MHLKVAEEEADVRRERPWVRVHFSEPVRGGEMLQVIEEELRHRLPRCHPCEAEGYLLQCSSTEEQEEFLRFDKWFFNGVQIFVSPYKYVMTPDDVLRFVSSWLRCQEVCASDTEARGVNRDPLPVQKSVDDSAAVVKTRKTPPPKLELGSWRCATGSYERSKGKPSSFRREKTRSDSVAHPRDPPRILDICFSCRKVGRDCRHDFRLCEFWRLAHDLKAPRRKVRRAL